jgi:anti-sigma regulatory factor (Ser/Thr protein kinase)
VTGQTAQRTGFHHEAFFYADDDEFLAGTVPFVEEGVATGQAVLVALRRSRRGLLRAALGAAAAEVEFQPMEQLGRNPGRLISFCREALREHHPYRAVRGLGEPVWAGRSAAEMEECERHEQLLNLAFGQERALAFMCPYDTSALDDEVLAGAVRSHPDCSDAHGRSASSRFTLESPLEGSLPRPEDPTVTFSFGARDLRTVRRVVSERGRAVGMDPHRNDELLLAISEVAANSVQHGGGGGSLQVWSEADALVCDVRDAGRIEDPLVGRERPRPERVDGLGLWIANQLCDLVQIRSGEQGTHVRLRMAIQP